MDPIAFKEELIVGGLTGFLLRVFPNGKKNRLRGRYKDNEFAIEASPGSSYSLSMDYNGPEITKAFAGYIKRTEGDNLKCFRYKDSKTGQVVVDWEIKVPRLRERALGRMIRKNEIRELVELVG